ISPRPSFADQVLRQFSVRGYEVRKTYETNGLQTAIGLVAAGMGVTIVPNSVQRLNRTDIAYRPILEEGLTSPLIMTVRLGDKT
ncbi:LysR substrate-binding domain-containing protein, partial [Acinetobacter baumannii]